MIYAHAEVAKIQNCHGRNAIKEKRRVGQFVRPLYNKRKKESFWKTQKFVHY